MAETTPDALVKDCCDCAEGQRSGWHDQDCVTRRHAFAVLRDRYMRLHASLTAERTARQQAEQERDTFRGAWEAAAAQAKDYIERHAHERITRKQAEVLLAEADQALATLRAQLDALRGYAQHTYGCACLPCEGNYDGTVCTVECPKGDQPCDCGLHVVLAALTEQP